jgi:tripartite-type tricarboxylate transporter receptor subunit TctC
MMKFSLRAAGAVLLSLAATLAAAPALADSYPTKPITIIVPFPPGGTTDVLARTVGQKLGDVLGQPVIVENRPGAGATIGAAYVAHAHPDGYTLLMGAVHHTIATSVYSSLPYDFQKDLTPVTVVALVPNVLAINPSVPARNVQELIAYGKAHPGALNFGSNGQGTAQHLIGEEFSLMTGVKMVHVPYKGSAPLVTDLMAGQIQLSFDTITPDLPQIKAGKLRPLAVTTARRSPALPDVPTLAEAGLSGFDMGSWFGILAPAKTPKEIVARLNAEIVKILNQPDVQKTFADIGAQKVGDSPAQMAALIKSDTGKYGTLARKIGVKID